MYNTTLYIRESIIGWVKVDNTHGAGHFPIEQIRIKKNNGVQGQMEQIWLADSSYKIPQNFIDRLYSLPSFFQTNYTGAPFIGVPKN